jgi:protein-L-isoaspartate O-methyltransferase
MAGMTVMIKIAGITVFSCILVALCFASNPLFVPVSADTKAFDDNVRETLDSHNRSWGGMNVPEADGKALYDIIIKHGYKSALEIGTSNGYSGLWIAWALSKTGGKLITLEIDKGRYEEALEYFRKAGLSKFIDARLGNAHDIVPALPGSFDFVFCDADKEWYENYLRHRLKIEAALPHNVSDSSSWEVVAEAGEASKRTAGGFWNTRKLAELAAILISRVPAVCPMGYKARQWAVQGSGQGSGVAVNWG